MTETKVKSIGELADELYKEAKGRVPKAEIRLCFNLELQNLKKLCAEKDVPYQDNGVITKGALVVLYYKIRTDVDKNYPGVLPNLDVA
jgi:hypothetical protein